MTNWLAYLKNDAMAMLLVLDFDKSLIFRILPIMISEQKEECNAVLLTSVSYLQNSGYEDIKANVEGLELPKSYTKKSDNSIITPDIVAYKNGRKYYFEIGQKSDEPNLLKTKWRFIEVISRAKNDQFKIITTRGNYKFTDDMLKDLNLTKKVIRL